MSNFARLLILFSFFVFAQWSQAQSNSVLNLENVELNEFYRAQLEKAIITDAPAMVIVSDTENLKVAVFVSGQPERQELSSYVLVDVMDSSNGKLGHETPDGIFKLVSERMKEKDYSKAYRTPLEFTLFWRDLRTKEFDGIGFHAARASRIPKIGVKCTSHGCVNLMPSKAEQLFQEVKSNFSSHANGSDALIVSSSGANSNIPSSQEWDLRFPEVAKYWDRWSLLAQEDPSVSAKSYVGEPKIKLSAISPDFNNETMLIDSRRPIAGNGDTASSIYLIQNLIRRGFKGNVDVLVDERSERILKALSKNLPGFEKRVNLIYEQNLSDKEYSLVIRSGLPSGRIFLDGLNFIQKSSVARVGKINVSAKTVFLALTIYGNTKNKASVQPLSLTAQGDKFFLLPATGLDVERSSDLQLDVKSEKSGLDFNEAGIFRDPFSLSIRNWSMQTIEKFLLKQTKIVNPNLHLLMANVINARKNENLKYSLAYGFSIPQVKRQARDYFKGLLASPTPIVVLTPSAFGQDLLNSFTAQDQARIRLTSLKEFSESNHQLSRSHLTVVQIPNVPHQIFATLLLASNRNRVVPLGSGDGFFTTALSLGVPFAPTIVEWNIRNVRALGRILQLEALRQRLDFSYLQNLRRVFSAIPSDPIQLAHSQQLLRYDDIFRSAMSQIPDLSETIDRAVGFLRTQEQKPPGLVEMEFTDRVYTRTQPIVPPDDHNSNNDRNPYGDLLQCKDLF